MRAIGLIIFCSSGLLAWHGQAQPEEPSPLKANRPGVSESPGLVIPGALQIETGYSLRKNKALGIETFNYIYNTLTLRYGVSKHFELRLRNDYLGNREIDPNNTTVNTVNGFGPLSLGASIQVSTQKGILPDAYFISSLRFKTGASEFRPTYTSPDMVLALGHSLNEKWYMTNHIGAAWDGRSPDAIFAYVLCFDIELNNNASCFVESYNYFKNKSPAQFNWDAGFYYRITALIQLDVSVGTGISATAEDLFLDGGITARLFK